MKLIYRETGREVLIGDEILTGKIFEIHEPISRVSNGMIVIEMETDLTDHGMMKISHDPQFINARWKEE